MEPSRTGTRDREPPGRKSVLFCANCGHDSAVEGDWILHERRGSGSVWYQCPECGRAVSVRPARSLDESRLPSPISAGSTRGSYGIPEASEETDLWRDLWQTYGEVTSAWLRPWSDSCPSAEAD